MKKICFAFNHLEYSGGVSRVAIGIANHLAENPNVEVTLRPLFKYEKSIVSQLNPRIIVRPLFGFYFRGFAQILEKLPKKFIHNMVFDRNYDIEIGFQHGLATVAAGSYDENRTSKNYVWVHGYDDHLQYLKYYQKADCVICVSKFNADRLYEESNHTVKTEYCYNPIDDQKIVEAGKEEVTDIPTIEGLKFISVGRLSAEKGFDRLVNCFAKLKNQYQFHCILIGNGPQYEQLQKQIEQHDLQSYVTLLGERKNPHAYTAKCDLFICSSYAEGYSTTCTEAIMLGVPVLSTKVSGAEEIILEAESGLVVENSEEGLLEGLEKILKNPSLITEWKNTITTTKSHFSYETRVKKLDELLGIE